MFSMTKVRSGVRRSSACQGLIRRLSAPLEGSGALSTRRYKPAMVLCRASDTISASAKESTCRSCGLVRRRCRPHKKARSWEEECTMSLSKRISFLEYAEAWQPQRIEISSCIQLACSQNSPESRMYRDAECSRPWLTHHQSASPHTGRRPQEPPPQRGEMVIRQDGRGPHPVGMAPSLIREHLFHTRRLRIRGDVKPHGRSDPPP